MASPGKAHPFFWVQAAAPSSSLIILDVSMLTQPIQLCIASRPDFGILKSCQGPAPQAATQPIHRCTASRGGCTISEFKIVSCLINYMVSLLSPFGFTSIQLRLHIKILSNPFWFHQIFNSRSLEFDFDVLGFGLVRSGFISYIWVRTISEPVCFFPGECPLRQCTRLAKRTTEKTMGL